jgi:hypothetical protein
MFEYPDRRINPLVYTMVSSGIRVGAWDYLRWKDIQPIEKDGDIFFVFLHLVFIRIMDDKILFHIRIRV